MPTTASAPRVWLTLLLQGGHRESLSLPADSPLFDKLRDTLTGQLTQPWLFEIPLREGSALLTVHSAQIVGVLTEPPMPLTVGLTPAVRVAEPAAAPQAPVAVANTGFADGFAKAKAVRVENVLTTDQHLSLIDFATRNRQLFGTSGTTTAAVNYRESLVCGHFAPFDELLRRRVQLLLPKVCEQLGIAVPEGATEIQLTAHNHGHYYKIHNDNGSEALAHRAVSFVYYFHRQPKAFTGGALRLVDRQVVNGLLTPAETYKDIEPLDNSIVFFDSRELHEVRPVDCPSLNFADSRFTINGWVAKTQAISADTTGG